MLNKTRKHSPQKCIESRLTVLEKQLHKTLRDRLARVRAASRQSATEFLDIVTDSETNEMAARLVESDSRTLHEVEEALRMLREGRYGICEMCGHRISRQRLKARPFSTVCIRCKEKLERHALPSQDPLYIPDETPIEVRLDTSDAEEQQPTLEDFFKDSKVTDVF